MSGLVNATRAAAKVLIAVRSIDATPETDYWALWGSAFGEEHDPASDGSYNYASFDGDLVIVGSERHALRDACVGRIHSTRRGFGWTLSPDYSCLIE